MHETTNSSRSESADDLSDAATVTTAINPPVYDRRNLPSNLDPAPGWKARIGGIVLSSDLTLECELRRIIDKAAFAEGNPESVALYCARIRNEPSVNPETLAAMEARIADTADLLLPGTPLDVIVYGCTSASIIIGSDKVESRVHETRPGVLVTNPVLATKSAFGAMGIHRFALVTPYIESITRQMRDYFVSEGYDVPAMGSFSRDDDNEVGRIDAASIYDAAMEFGARPDVDAVFVSCTAIRMTGLIEKLEQDLGKPVTCSNHAMAWHALRSAGVNERLEGLGTLFRDH